jgi:hypothetical protein
MNIEHYPKIWLPRTGQVTSYAAGDDGYFRAGNPRVTRFVDNGNGTISDRGNENKLWAKQPELIVSRGSGNAVGKGNWAANTAYNIGDVVLDAGGGGGDGLIYQCIVARDNSSSAHPAADPACWLFWPWCADAIDPLDNPGTMDWPTALTQINGMSNISAISKASPGQVTTAKNHYLRTGDSITITGVVGMTQVNGQTFTVTKVDATKFTLGVDTSGYGAWSSGGIVHGPNGLRYCGYTDWRLPNAVELGSTINFGASSPASWLPNTKAAVSYWSGTTGNIVGSGSAIRAYYDSCQLNGAAKTSLFYVRPIRGGRLNGNG